MTEENKPSLSEATVKAIKETPVTDMLLGGVLPSVLSKPDVLEAAAAIRDNAISTAKAAATDVANDVKDKIKAVNEFIEDHPMLSKTLENFSTTISSAKNDSWLQADREACKNTEIGELNPSACKGVEAAAKKRER